MEIKTNPQELVIDKLQTARELAREVIDKLDLDVDGKHSDPSTSVVGFLLASADNGYATTDAIQYFVASFIEAGNKQQDPVLASAYFALAALVHGGLDNAIKRIDREIVDIKSNNC